MIRTICVSIILAAVLTISITSIDKKDAAVEGIVDYTLIWTKPINDYFREDIMRRNVLMIVCSAFMDVLQFAQIYRFVRYGTTWRGIIALLFFYGIRALI